jgi:hypothetical protein
VEQVKHVAHLIGERGRKTAKGGECRILKAKEIEENYSFRNRQVASSTLDLGSSIPLSYSDLENSLDNPRLICCKIGASCEFFVERVERIYLRFVHRLYIHVHRERDVAVPQNRLYVLVCNA